MSRCSMQALGTPNPSQVKRAAPASFRQRCASALMHPVTLAALGVLLVNDLVFKALWPGAWVPGKLSDLAWMMFAPPVLAYVLSFATRGNQQAQRAAFMAAYVGLPLLYVAFNTFQPVHDVVLHVLGWVGGEGPRSPLDPTDSIVIPFAMAAAIWVWRRPPVEAQSIRTRLAYLATVAAALTSVATSYDIEWGVSNVGRIASGTIGANTFEGFYESMDAGLTWAKTGEDFVPLETRQLMELGVKEPSGIFSGGNIRITNYEVLSSGKEVYSFEYLQSGGNRWMQALDKRDVKDRAIATRPLDIFYDGWSGNLILAMGLQGVVVVAPDGTTTRVAVGPYSPTDFSFWSKTRTFFGSLASGETAGNTGLAFLLAFSFAAFAVAGSAVASCARILLALAVSMSTFLTVFVGVYPYVSEKPADATPGQYFLEILGLLLSGFGWFPFLVGEAASLLVVLGLVFLMIVGGMVWAGTTRRQALTIASVGLGMLLLIGVGALVLFETGPLIANFVAVGLVGLTAFGLWAYRKRRRNL